MKKSILGSTLLTAFLVGTLLTSGSLYGMQSAAIDEDSSDESERVSSEETVQEQTGWGVRAFLASPVAGAREFLRYCRRATAYLVGNNGVSTDNCEEDDCKLKEDNATLVASFLRNPAAYALLAESLPQDKRWLLARYLVKNHPLKRVMRGRIGRHCCIRTLEGHGDMVRSAQFNAAGDRIVTASGDRTAKIWDVGKLLAVIAWLDRDCTLEQALLLHCICESRIIHALLQKKRGWLFRASSLRFDFNKCAHLQDCFDTMPAEVQGCLEKFVIRKA